MAHLFEPQRGDHPIEVGLLCSDQLVIDSSRRLNQAVAIFRHVPAAVKVLQLQRPIGWSSDGKQIYAVEYEKGTIVAIPAEKGDPRTIVTLPLPAGRTLTDAAITSDGRRIAYVVSESQSDVWMIENFDPEAQ